MEILTMPDSVKALVNAQQRHDNKAYAKSFTPHARVFDEGKTHKGHDEIIRWIGDANTKYNTVMEALDYKESFSGGVLKAKISGTFPGSPVVLTYHMEFEKGLISSLKITAA
jgi:hypothetical protein